MAVKEFYDVGDDTEDYPIGGSPGRILYQTFTPQEDFTLGAVRLKLWRFAGDSSNFRCSLLACDGDGNPTGDYLQSSALVDYTSITLTSPGRWYTFTFAGYALVAGTKYALQIGEAVLRWRYDSTVSDYPRGHRINLVGTTYTQYPGTDFMFETYDTVGNLREYTLRGVTNERGKPIANAWCRAYDSSDSTNLILVEEKYTNENGAATFIRLPLDKPVDINIIWGSHSSWIRNVVDGWVGDFVTTSAGAADVGKGIKLDADGNVDATCINDADIDHGGIGGLADDDHPQYIKHSLATAVNDFLVASGAGAFVKKTLAEVMALITNLGTLGTKNPPIDADKVIYRDSVASDVLVTSTWTQIKAFLKTYYDTIYAAISHAHAGSDITSGTIDGDRLPAMSAAKKGGVPATGAPAGKYLKDDGTFDTPAGGGAVATDPIWDAKGDLAVGTGPDTAARLAVGTDGKYLKAASGEATGLLWATPAGAGDMTKAIYDPNDDGVIVAAQLDTGILYKALYDAYTILMATSDNTPEAIIIAAQQVVGRLTGGAIKGLSVAELQALLFSLALTENVEIRLTAALSADGKYSGITEAGIAGATLAFGDLVYFQTADSRWELASADNAAAGHNLKLGICILAAAGDGSATTVLLWGKVRADTAFPALTIGAPIYMGLVAGDVQVAAPTLTTDVVRIIGYGNTADELFFCPDNTYLQLV